VGYRAVYRNGKLGLEIPVRDKASEDAGITTIDAFEELPDGRTLGLDGGYASSEITHQRRYDDRRHD
jgi:hypothetical protein